MSNHCCIDSVLFEANQAIQHGHQLHDLNESTTLKSQSSNNKNKSNNKQAKKQQPSRKKEADLEDDESSWSSGWDEQLDDEI